MINDIDNAAKIAEYLLQIKAIKLQPNDPFTWSSGWKSPIYCDNRKTLSYPQIRTHIRQVFSKAVLEEYGKPDIIAGVATGGIAMGALVAQELGVPFVYVRSSAKGHGLENMIEGDYSTGSNVVVIEDLISTGGSSLKAVEALRSAELNVKGVIAIFNYGFETATKAFEEAKCQLNVLSNYEVMIDIALKQGTVTEKDMDSLKKWRVSPETWG
ncbi:orotate phosphoribosyltransferase [Brumimicrobium aurantiacum]|uniref:Orotate phosphoribosyltransferase n=1 Tax=Brumimicrobium aurantiacum TaxID=1737063 RepID=A0A3E1F002_9FLAO|nr:orotate phosphoribosyltransferase [Brumimicrobium aurantiacum]RFC55128.1 orotate phosphoribosyltransferase [Brumimicrobium aurantiacum]